MDAKVCHKNGGEWLSKAHLCNFKRMKSPKYSSIEWQPHDKGFKVDTEYVVAKGTVDEIKKDSTLNRYVKMKKTELPIRLKIESGRIVKWGFGEPEIKLADTPLQADTMRVGNSLYSRRKIYEVAEEIAGEKILTKEDPTLRERSVAKKAVGMKLELNALQGMEPDLPLIIEGNKGYYLIAPIIKND